jgi:DNA-binding FrmR family transcriptional regulator
MPPLGIKQRGDIMQSHSYGPDKKEILIRLRRMEGQLKGIQKMIEDDKYCVDVLNQLSSIIAATQKVANMIMKDHIQGCVRDALTHDDRSQEHINELISVVEKFTKR